MRGLEKYVKLDSMQGKGPRRLQGWRSMSKGTECKTGVTGVNLHHERVARM